MSWNPDEYPDESQVQEVLSGVEQEHNESIAHEQAVVETLSEAMKRIEEANLWKALLTMDIFQPGSARIEIVNSINAKLKKVALENLELCVGIKSEAAVPVQQKIELPFDTEEMQALKILAAKVLKRDVTQATLNQSYTPQVSQVASVGNKAGSTPVVNVVKATAPQQQAPTQQARPAAKAPVKRSGKPKPTPGPGYIPPASGYVPPSQAGATVSSQGVSNQQVNMNNLVSQLIQQASGGNLLATNNNPVSDVDDINERA